MANKVFFKNLDGLRFLCFLSVFFYHSFHTELDFIKADQWYRLVKFNLFGNGNLGVNFFFVLSGFLITYLLIKEKNETGVINIRNFYLRRIFRIWPLFYFCVLFGFIFFPMLKELFGHTSTESGSVLYYLFFVNNFDVIENGNPDASILGVLWSLAIEEQFYLIWPLILFIVRPKNYWIPFSMVILFSLLYRFYTQDYIRLEKHTLSCIGDMAVGALGTWLVLYKVRFKDTIVNAKRYWIVLLYLLVLLVYLFRKELFWGNSITLAFDRLIISIIFLMVILDQNYGINSLFKMSNYKWVSKLGVISYGLYCLHFLGILCATVIGNMFDWNNSLTDVLIIQTILSLALTIIIAQVSYKFFESPFLKIKRKFSAFDD